MLPASDLQMQPFGTPTLHGWRGCIQASNPEQKRGIRKISLFFSFFPFFFVSVTSELIVLLKGKSDAKSWVYPLPLFFREYGPPVSIALFPLSVLFYVHFLQILKLSLRR